MKNKITLITPPDIFQNDQESILLVDITEQDQDLVSVWLGKTDIDLNIYFYQGETNVEWLLHSLSCSTVAFVNLNNMSAVTSHLAGFLLSKPYVYYATDDKNVSNLFSYINHNQVNDVVDFLERTFNGKE